MFFVEETNVSHYYDINWPKDKAQIQLSEREKLFPIENLCGICQLF
jgi:hypothetical protein